MLTLAQKLISFRTSLVATACGVVTITAPASCGVLVEVVVVVVESRVSASEMCSSEVPGGVSMRR